MLYHLILLGSLVLTSMSLEPTKDPITGRDVSGNRQTIEVGQAFERPFRVTVMDENHRIVSGYPVEFLVLFGDTVEQRLVNSDDLGVALFTPSTLQKTGPGFVVAQVDGSKLVYRFEIVRKGFSWLILIQLLGGFALFFFGLRRGRQGLLRIAGARMRRMLWGLTRNRFLSVVGGFMSTLVLQSSTATSVMLVSFANSALIGLGAAIAAALGASLATTVTAQILAFRVLDYSVLILAVGYLIEMSKGRLRPFGRFIFGFGLVFFGIKIMADGASGLKVYPWFDSMIQSFGSNKPFGLIASALFTGLVHSSAATLGVGLSLAFDHLLTSLDAVLILVIGANIGTSFTALVASLNGQAPGKRTAVAYLLAKLFTAAVALVFIGPYGKLVLLSSGDMPRQIANAHLIFNLALLVLCFPLIPLLERILLRSFRTTETSEGQPLDNSLLEAPEMAVSLAHRRILQMGDRVFFMLRESFNTFKHRNMNLTYRIREEDDFIDRTEEQLTPFLTRLMEQELSPGLTKRVKLLLFAIDELEHIGDIISKSVMKHSERMYRDGLQFSDAGLSELKEFHSEVLKTTEVALSCLTSLDREQAKTLANRKEIVDRLKKQLHLAHLGRLARATEETLLTTTIHLDLIDDLERVNSYASHIGTEILEEGE